MCTSAALSSGFCNFSSLGHFIFDLPSDKVLSDTTFWNARVGFRSTNSTPEQDPPRTTYMPDEGSSFWDNPDGNPNPPESDYDTPFFSRRDILFSSRSLSSVNSRASATKSDSLRRQNSTGSTSLDTLWYENPIKYEVHDTGYYCVGGRFWMLIKHGQRCSICV